MSLGESWPSVGPGVGDDVAKDDAEILERASFIYDALLAHLNRIGNPRSP